MWRCGSEKDDDGGEGLEVLCCLRGGAVLHTVPWHHSSYEAGHEPGRELGLYLLLHGASF